VSGLSKLTTTDIDYPHVVVSHRLEGRIDRSEVVLATLNEVESSMLDIQSLAISMDHLNANNLGTYFYFGVVCLVSSHASYITRPLTGR